MKIKWKIFIVHEFLKPGFWNLCTRQDRFMEDLGVLTRFEPRQLSMS